MAQEVDDLETAVAYTRKALAHNHENSVAKRRLQQLLRLKEMKQG